MGEVHIHCEMPTGAAIAGYFHSVRASNNILPAEPLGRTSLKLYGTRDDTTDEFAMHRGRSHWALPVPVVVNISPPNGRDRTPDAAIRCQTCSRHELAADSAPGWLETTIQKRLWLRIDASRVTAG